MLLGLWLCAFDGAIEPRLAAAIPPTSSTPYSGSPLVVPGRIDIAGFDNGGPETHRGSRPVGQLAGGRPVPTPSPVAVPPAPAPAAVPQHLAGTPLNNTNGHGQSGYSTAPQPHVPSSPHGTPVPAFLSSDAHAATATGQLEVPRIFEEDRRRRDEDLDVPDFLK